MIFLDFLVHFQQFSAPSPCTGVLNLGPHMAILDIFGFAANFDRL